MDENSLNLIKQWLLKLISGTISPEEQRQLDAWKSQSLENRKLVEAVTDKGFLKRAILDSNKRKQAAAWQKLYFRLGYKHSSLRLRGLWRAAAAVLLLIAGTAAWLHFRSAESDDNRAEATPIIYMDTKGYAIEGSAVRFSQFVKGQAVKQVRPNGRKADYTEITVPMGSEYKIVLEDSTRLHLNSGTTLRIPYDYTTENRSVFIDGEAYMEVRHDEAHPFCVSSSRMEVKVLGTKFNIDDYSNENEARLTLADGRVEVINAGKKATLLPGQEVVATGHDLELHHADVYEATAWHSERIVFVNRTLENIMRHLARWYNFTPEYAGEHIRSMRMTIDIDRHETFRQVATMIEKTNGISININKNKVLLSERP